MPRTETPYIEKIFKKYEYLAHKYAKKVFNYERLGLELDDVVQELRIKIYTSIITYGEKWAEYKEQGKYKPVPLEYYLKSAMNNKVKDFVKKLNTDSVEAANKLSIESNSFDFSTHSTMSSSMFEGSNIKENIIEINGVDLLDGLTGGCRNCFVLYLKGFTVQELENIFRKNDSVDVQRTIKFQIKKLQNRKKELLDYKSQEFTVQVYEE